MHFDFGEIQALSTDMPDVEVLLSDTSRLIILAALSYVERWHWSNSGDRLTDEEWDAAKAWLDLAQEEVLQEV
jgi:hypothetical protein